MTVNYYGITGCSYEVCAERPVLRAPLGVPEEYLRRTAFAQQPDGSWVHFLTAEENSFILSCDPNLPIIFQNAASPPPAEMTPEEKQRANIMCAISAGLMLLAGALGAARIESVSEFIWIPALAAWVLAVIVRVKYPRNLFGKVLMIVYITLFVVMLIAMIIGGILLIYACTQCMQQCPD